MLFNSFEFAVFLPVTLILYWMLPHRWQNRLLLVASYFFYGYWDWRFLSLIALSTIIDYLVGLRIHALDESRTDGYQAAKKRYLRLSILANLGILGFFKYFDFFSGSVQDLLGLFGLQPDWFTLNILLPVGISFYTFQTMSYTIDIYRGEMKPTRDLLGFAVYVAFFPQLVAGPIERARALVPRILNRRSFHRAQFIGGLHLILLGLFKKVFVADNMGPIVDRIFANPDPTGWEVLVGGWAFAFQVYGDFAGYSDIARGCSKCMGIELMVNFRFPYAATSPVERWRRWHISLSSWLRDYLYIPLGGSRSGSLMTYRNLALTMVIGGLWHGAGWNYIIWGAWEGAMLVVHRLFSPLIRFPKVLKSTVPAFGLRVFQILLMYNLVSIGLVIFRGQSLAHIGKMLKRLVTWHGVPDWSLVVPLAGFALPLVLYEIAISTIAEDDVQLKRPVPLEVRGIVYGVMFYLLAFHGAAAQSFIYFQF